MDVFSAYANYYDLLYRDKDYAGEADYVASLVERHHPDAKSLLELGCGTGKHAALLAQRGYAVHGIDRSDQMLEQANALAASLSSAVHDRLTFSAGDVRTARTGRTFDAAISLFHVVSYQTTNDDLLAMFANAASQLDPGGVFIFDYWYGPAVLTDRPERRIKTMESDFIKVTRHATPSLDTATCIVDVNYDVTVTDKASGQSQDLHETHHMRYLFLPEIDWLARLTGFTVVHSEAWLTGDAPGDATWGACSILRK